MKTRSHFLCSLIFALAALPSHAIINCDGFLLRSARLLLGKQNAMLGKAPRSQASQRPALASRGTELPRVRVEDLDAQKPGYEPYFQTAEGGYTFVRTTRKKGSNEIVDHRSPTLLGLEYWQDIFHQAHVLKAINPANDADFLPASHGVVEFADGTSALETVRIKGESAHDVIASQMKDPNISVADKLGIFMADLAEMADVLDRAHRRGLVHGDVKPANFIQATDGHLVLIDFGGSYVFLADGSAIEPRLLHTTTRYLAPDVIPEAEDVVQHLKPEIDFYALAASMRHQFLDDLQLGSSGLPFTERRAQWKKNKAAYDKIDALLARLTAKDPHDRPTNASLLIKTLQAEIALAQKKP